MAVLQPKVTGDGTQDSWSFEATNNINLNEERVLLVQERLTLLLGVLATTPDDATIGDLKTRLRTNGLIT